MDKKNKNTLQEGDKAPDFKAQSDSGETIALSEFSGKTVVLYFYPKDDTPGCTIEACEFRDANEELQKKGVVILGVSKDSIKSHQKFVSKYELNFPLLADTEGEIISNYGVWKKKSMFGKTSLGIERSTFIIDKEGIVKKIYRPVKVKQHKQEVLDYINKYL